MRVEVITPDADPDHGGFGGRVHGLISMFSRFADVRVVLTSWFAGPRIPGVDYREMPLHDNVLTRLGRLKTHYRTRFPRRETADRPDLVVVESLDLLGLHQYGRDVPMILDEHNVYWDLLGYDIVNAPFFRGWLGRRDAVRGWLIPRQLDRARRFEIQAIRDSSRTLVTSETDRATILAGAPESAPKVRVLPNTIDTERIRALPDASESRNVLFVGDFNYVPNQEAAEFVSLVLAPNLPSARFLLVGSNPPSGSVGAPNVVAPGRVPDLQETLRDAAVCIAPLRHGSGTRVKILTYLAAARPVVATTKAVEGLPVIDGVHLLVRDDPAEFREAVGRLLDDPKTRRALGVRGRDLVESKFDWRVHVPWLREFSAEVCSEARPTTWSDDVQERSAPSPIH